MTTNSDRRRTSAKGRQDGDYTPPVLSEPAGGPVPAWDPPDEVEDDPDEGDDQDPQ
jgi:hypothetical protein